MGLFGRKSKKRRRAESRIMPLIAQLIPPSKEKIQALHETLGPMVEDGFTDVELEELIIAALKFAQDPYEEYDLCHFFILTAMTHAEEDQLGIIAGNFTDLTKEAQEAVAKFAIDMPPTTARVRFLAYLIITYDEQGILPAPFMDFEKLLQDPELANEFLAMVAEHVSSKEFSHNIYMLALALLNHQVMSEGAFNLLMEHAVPHYVKMAEQYLEIKDNPRWKFTEEGYHLKHYMPRSLDLISHAPGEFAGQLVMASFSHPLAEERIVALRALLMRGFEVPEEIIIELMQDPESRAQTYQMYQMTEQLDQLPEAYTTIEALAEGALTHWLSNPDEFKNAPDEIELMKTFKIKGREGSCFLYRFKCHEPHWKADIGWIAGLVGPLDPDDPDPMGGSLIGTAYTAWDKLTPKEHIKALVKDAKNPQRMPGEVGEMFAKMDNMLKDLEAQAAAEAARNN